MWAMRIVVIVWAAVGLGPLLLQLRGFAAFVPPHKMSEDFVTPSGLPVETADLHTMCPVTAMFFAGAGWNACPTHYYRLESGVFCHIIVPQYNVHGNYFLRNHSVANTSSSCSNRSFPFEMNFYHGSIGYYSIYAEANGTFCTQDNTAYVQVDGVGTYDINGVRLAEDKGTHAYRMSYWYIVSGTVFLLMRGFALRRSFKVCKRFAERYDRIGESIRIQEAVVYIQESMRLSAHGAKNSHRLLLLFLIIDQGVMSDLFLLSTQEGLLGRIQSISLGYNLASVMSMLFEMVETMNWMSERQRCLVKRLLFNYETVMLGELITAGLLRSYLTSVNRSHLRDLEPAAEVASHYVVGLTGHLVLALGCLSIIMATRTLGAIGIVWWKFGTLRVLTKTCSVDAALGARCKLILLSEYVLENEELYYKPSTLKALGVLKAIEPDSGQLFIHNTLDWISIPRTNLTVLGTVSDRSVQRCSERPCLSVVTFFDESIGGAATDASSFTQSTVVPMTSRYGCCNVFQSLWKWIHCFSKVVPGPTPAKIKPRTPKYGHVPPPHSPAWEITSQGPPGYIEESSIMCRK